MTYKLGNRSNERLEGVDPSLQAVVRSAIGRSEQDFSVICGLRTRKEQEALVAKGASQTMKSKHLGGYAVDLMAYIDGGRWELNLYDEIADATALRQAIAGMIDSSGSDWKLLDAYITKLQQWAIVRAEWRELRQRSANLRQDIAEVMETLY